MEESKPKVPLSVPRKVVAPPRHRLFAIFDDPDVGRHVVEQLRSEGHGEEGDIWVFYGEEGLRSLDAAGRTLGLGGRIVRMVERLMTSDVSYFQTLDDALRGGALVVAIRMPDEKGADALAKELRSRSAHSFAYGAHFDFVPVAA